LIVVPILAPKIIPRELVKLSSPALTKPTAATVVALDDCRMAVMVAPVMAPVAGLLVKRIMANRMALPAGSCRPSLMLIMPRINRPMPPAA